MTKQFFFLLVGIYFIIISAFHFLRLMFEWDFSVGSWTVPAWTSGLIVLLAALVAYLSLKLSFEEKKEDNKDVEEDREE